MIWSGGPLIKPGSVNSSTVQGHKPESVRSMEDGGPNCEHLGLMGKGELLRSAPRKLPEVKVSQLPGDNYGLRERAHTSQDLRVESDSDVIH